MDNVKKSQWILRIGIFGVFFAHGIFALQVKESFVPLITGFGFSSSTAVSLLPLIGVLDIIVALLTLLWPLKIVLVWATIWAFMTGLSRPVAGEVILEFVERWSAWAAPLALLALQGFPKKLVDLFKK